MSSTLASPAAICANSAVTNTSLWVEIMEPPVLVGGDCDHGACDFPHHRRMKVDFRFFNRHDFEREYRQMVSRYSSWLIPKPSLTIEAATPEPVGMESMVNTDVPI